MNKVLLEAAAKHLESLKGKQLQMGNWLTQHFPDREPKEEFAKLVLHNQPELECGFAGCAIGECSYTPEFQAAGITPKFLLEGRLETWGLVREILGISEAQMTWVFHVSQYRPQDGYDDVATKTVAHRIRMILANPDHEPKLRGERDDA